MERAILHCDLNNFYASVECRDFPHLKGKAVAVCGRQEERHGIVLAKNELAKKYGVSTGEPIFQAKKNVHIWSSHRLITIDIYIFPT